MIARTTLSRGITAHRLCKNVTLYLNELTSPGARVQSQTPEDHKPLMLMLPWLGSRPQAVSKYCEIYFRTGFDVLVVESEVRQNKNGLSSQNKASFDSGTKGVHSFHYRIMHIEVLLLCIYNMHNQNKC